jgi:DNA-binding MarR family transcriptional regulator
MKYFTNQKMYVTIQFVAEQYRGSYMYRDPIGHRIKTLNNLMRKTMDKQTGRPDRATLMHCWIIGFVEEREYIGLDTFPKDIEKEFSINRSTTSEMLKLMCKNGMITREEVDYDARLKKIVLTEASRQHNRNIEDKMRKMHQQLIKDLSDDEINAFIKISDKLINNIKEGL